MGYQEWLKNREGGEEAMSQKEKKYSMSRCMFTNLEYNMYLGNAVFR